MTYEQLKKANELIKTTDVKGKAYAEVNQRVKAFRSLYPNGAIMTEMISNEEGICVFKASILDDDGDLIATGTAYEKESSSYINKTSYIENCETSAVGRALGFCGFGIDTSIASAEEVENAINNQQRNDKPKLSAKNKGVLNAMMLSTAKTLAVTTDEIGKQICATFKFGSLKDVTDENAEAVIDILRKWAGVPDEVHNA